MLGHALELATRGWPVFPLGTRAKLPAIGNPHPRGSAARQKCRGECGLDGHGLHDATSDLARVEAWWSGNGTWNIAIRPPANIIVIDLDPRHDGDKSWSDLQRSYRSVPATLTVWSGRGDGGCHLYWQHAGGGKLTSTRLGPGIDLKGHFGYVVAPPSIHPDSGRAYRWQPAKIAPLPDWLAALMRPPAPPKVDTRASSPVDADRRVRGLLEKLLAAGEGERNRLLFWTSCRFGELVSHGHIAEVDAIGYLETCGRRIGLDDLEVARTVRSGITSGSGGRS